MKTFEIKLVTTITKTYRIRAKDEEEASKLAHEYPPHNHPNYAAAEWEVEPSKLGVIRSRAKTHEEWVVEVPYPEEPKDWPIFDDDGRAGVPVRRFCAYCGEEGHDEVMGEPK
jgi:hypothetical protein